MIGQQYRPVALRRTGTIGVEIDWSDGHRSEYTWRWLRENCPCANCRQQREGAQQHLLPTGQGVPPPTGSKVSLPVVGPGEVGGNPFEAVSVTPVGRYAYKIVWADGHDTGIYSFELLRQLCQCSDCRARRQVSVK
jgi:DUF971 family protein